MSEAFMLNPKIRFLPFHPFLFPHPLPPLLPPPISTNPYLNPFLTSLLLPYPRGRHVAACSSVAQAPSHPRVQPPGDGSPRVLPRTGRQVSGWQEGEWLAGRYNCRRRLLRNLQEMGFEHPTAIQRQVVPLLLQGRECFACAPTGSGKTVAFLLPIVMALKSHSPEAIRAVVLVPTRELALQISRALKQLAAGTKLRARLLTKATAGCVELKGAACDVLISTPLRLAHLVTEKKVDLSRVQHLVLDEADKLFEMGFVEQIDGVVAACSLPALTRSLFSATLPEAVEQLARSVMHDPVRIVVGDRNAAAETVQQKLVFVGTEEGKLLAMRQLLQQGVRPPVLIFVQSKERAQQLFSELSFDGLNVDVIHADRSVAQREQVVDLFREGKIWFLIATDLMGRGMDIAGVNVVVNYDCPQTTAAYIHRIGRSGRAGRPGEAVTFYTEEDEPNLRAIANVMVQSGTEVPAWMKYFP
ncbi:unnamed protein product [Closterium sp. Naga37s-1]|nr:unnamed protein product [Closterium sp. Naga37s-1]